MVKIPLKSKAQLRKFGHMESTGEISQAEFQHWLKATPNIKALPERVRKKKKKAKKSKKKSCK
jgi:hypothetical protein